MKTQTAIHFKCRKIHLRQLLRKRHNAKNANNTTNARNEYPKLKSKLWSIMNFSIISIIDIMYPFFNVCLFYFTYIQLSSFNYSGRPHSLQNLALSGF